MIINVLICIFFATIFTKPSTSDLFTSYSDMIKLDQQKVGIKEILKNYLKSEQEKINKAKRYFT
jgi:hypothetical protein